MIKVKNTRKITICILGKNVPPLGTVEVEKAAWEKEYSSSKILREALRLGFISAKQEKKSKDLEKKEKK